MNTMILLPGFYRRALAGIFLLAGGGVCLAEPVEPGVARLSQKLESKYHFARLAAIEKLARLEAAASSAVPALIERLTGDDHQMVRLRAAWALGVIKQPIEKTVPALIAIQQDPDAPVRLNATNALLEIGEDSAPSLRLALKSEHVHTRFAAAKVLVRLPGESLEEPLMVLAELCREDDAVLRLSSVKALVPLAERAAPMVPTLTDLLDDPDTEVRRAAVETLQSTGAPPGTVEILISRMAIEPKKEVRQSLARCLGKVGTSNPETAPALVKAFADPDERVRANAADAVGKLGASAIPALVPCLEGEAKYPRQCAVDALVGMAEQARSMSGQLVPLLTADDWELRLRVASALGAIGDSSDSVLSALRKTAQEDKSEAVRQHAESALKKLEGADKRPADSARR